MNGVCDLWEWVWHEVKGTVLKVGGYPDRSTPYEGPNGKKAKGFFSIYFGLSLWLFFCFCSVHSFRYFFFWSEFPHFFLLPHFHYHANKIHSLKKDKSDSAYSMPLHLIGQCQLHAIFKPPLFTRSLSHSLQNWLFLLSFSSSYLHWSSDLDYSFLPSIVPFFLGVWHARFPTTSGWGRGWGWGWA